MNPKEPSPAERDFLRMLGGSWSAPTPGVSLDSLELFPHDDSSTLARRWLESWVSLCERAEATNKWDDLEADVAKCLELCNSLVKQEAPLILYTYGGLVGINRKRISLSDELIARLGPWMEWMGRLRCGGLRVQRVLSMEEFRPWLESSLLSLSCHVVSEQEQSGGLEPLSQEEGQRRCLQWAREEEGQWQRRLSSPGQHAMELYACLLRWVQHRYNPLQPRPPRQQATAILRAFLRLTEQHPLQFLGFHMQDELTAYQSYHVANTVMLSLLFGQALGLSRKQRLELGWAALEHDLGKLNIPANLLQKTEPLSAEEIEEIERLPLHTVKQLVGQEFGWDRLKQALIALDVRFRPVASGDSKPSNLTLSDEPSMVMSRIISLCSCFDALCSERPFRSALKPVDALALMRGPLAQQFDGVLLRRFVVFVWPSIRTAAGESWHVSADTAEDPRALDRDLAPPTLQELQRELYEYRTLKQISEPSPEERRRMQWLQRYLTLKLQAAMEPG